MAGALLADVQAGKAEGKDLGLADQVLQRFAAQASALEAVLDQFQVVAEFINRAVVQLLGGSGGHAAPHRRRWGAAIAGRLPAGIGQLLVALVGEPQPLHGVAELEPVGLESVAGSPLLVDLREAQPVHFQRLQQGGAHLAPLHRDAELVTELVHRLEIALQHQLALVAGGAPGDVRCHRRVAVPV